MARSVFYDCTPADEQQLRQLFVGTDHQLLFLAEPISTDNIDNQAEMISVFVSSTVTEVMIEQMPKLKLIACRSTGFNNIPLPLTEAKGITVTNVPTYGEKTVAEYTFALLLALSRKIRESAAAVQHGRINTKSIEGFDLYGKTFGILGAGHIGQHAARIAIGFGMRVIAYDPFPNQDRANEIGFSYASLDDVAAQSDVLSLQMPYFPSNHHIVNRELLQKCKTGVVLVNTARGELVRTKDLIAALQSEQVQAAALDVFEGEKLLHIEEEEALLHDAASPDLMARSVELQVLSQMPNVILTPHNAFNTKEALERINQVTAQNMIRYWYGETPNKVVAPPKRFGRLIISRHAESEWNAKGVWTGSRDVHLSEKGFREAALFGRMLREQTIDYAFTSQQIRAFETMEAMLDAKQQFDVPYQRSEALNERNYGDYTGLNKWEVQKQLGEEVFEQLRRSWDYPVPNGETLKAVYERVVPYYLQTILPTLMAGKNVLIVAHGNSIRSLVKYIESVSDKGIEDVEMLYGTILMYDVNDQGHMTNKETLHAEVVTPHM